MTVAIDTERAHALRARLADQLAAAGHERVWVDAVRKVPRHLFVPAYHQQETDSRWSQVRAGDESYLDGVYADQALTTQLTSTETGAGAVPTSSSSQPDLMLTMLDALDAGPGHRVYECGTGTGWNAALMSHRLGDAHVTTVDVDPELTATAVHHLAEAGYSPVVHTGDGAAGLPERGPFDRVIATCGMHSIPWKWVAQCADHAVMVVPIGWGLARITVEHGQVRGRFLPGGAFFMARRAPGHAPRFADLEHTAPSKTRVPLDDLVGRLQFPLSLALPGYNHCTWSDEHTGDVAALGIWTPDGSTATAGVDGRVHQLGPRRLWDTVEELHEVFPTAPVRAEFGLTLTPGRQHAWWRAEDGPSWDLPKTAPL